MRVTITLLACILSSISWSQGGKTESSDTTRVSLGNNNEIILVNKTDKNQKDSITVKKEKETDMHDFTYWSGLDIGFTGIMMTDQVKQDYEWFDINESKSVAVNLNIYETKIPIIKHYFGINTGLGFTWQDYVFSDTLSLINVQGDSISGISSLPVKYDKNKLKTGYIKVPLLVEINTSRNPDKNFHIAAGFVGGWNYRSLLKQEYELDGDKVKSKIKGDYNLNPWSLEATTRVGYGSFTLFASANLTGLFEEDKGPEVYPFTVGLTVLAF